MTITDLLSMTGAVVGVLVLVLMAALPLLLALPLPARRTPDVPHVTIPAQRTASPVDRVAA